MKRTIVMAIVVGTTLVAASYSTVRAQAPRSVVDGVYAAEQAKRGETLYAGACAECHDASLVGNIGPALAGRDFIAAWKDKTVGELFTKIKLSMPPMAPDPLTPEEAADVVSYVLSANQFLAGAAALAADATSLNDIHMAEPPAAGGGAAAAAGEPAEPVAEAVAEPAAEPAPAGDAAAGSPAGGLYADEQAKRGMTVYAGTCAMCHGPKLRGAIGPALAGPRFVVRWKDKGVSEVFDKIKTTMPQSAPGTLTPEQAADVVAFILSSNQYPGGAAELTADAAPQKTAPIGEPPQK